MTETETMPEAAPEPAAEPTIRVRHAPDDNHDRDTRIGVRLQCLQIVTGSLMRLTPGLALEEDAGAKVDRVEHAIATARRLEAYVLGEAAPPVEPPLLRRGPLPVEGRVGDWWGGQPEPVEAPWRPEVDAWVWLPDAYRIGEYAPLWVRPGRVAAVDETGWAMVDFGRFGEVGVPAGYLSPAGGPDERRTPPDAAAAPDEASVADGGPS